MEKNQDTKVEDESSKKEEKNSVDEENSKAVEEKKEVTTQCINEGDPQINAALEGSNVILIFKVIRLMSLMG